jgi:hypothetical protein
MSQVGLAPRDVAKSQHACVDAKLPGQHRVHAVGHAAANPLNCDTATAACATSG